MKKFFVFLALMIGLFIAALPDIPKVVDVDVGYAYILPRDQIPAGICVTPFILSSAEDWQVVCPLICPMYAGVEKPADSNVISIDMILQNDQIVSSNLSHNGSIMDNDLRQTEIRQMNRPEGMVTSRLDIGDNHSPDRVTSRHT